MSKTKKPEPESLTVSLPKISDMLVVQPPLPILEAIGMERIATEGISQFQAVVYFIQGDTIVDRKRYDPDCRQGAVDKLMGEFGERIVSAT